ncbi:MAG: GNAT family N-acetyltransferase [Bacteroidota bacterium]
MFKQTLYDAFSKMSPYDRHRLTKFLFDNQGDCKIEKKDITSAIEYAMKDRPSFGGYVVTAEDDNDNIIAATVVNKTGMAGYGPESILVYFATQQNTDYEVNRNLLDQTIKVAKGDIAFLVTPDNPWKAIFRKLGFESKLLEMKYSKPNRNSLAS